MNKYGIISIIIPTYNDIEKLFEITKEIDKLNFNKEFIVVDDGSTAKNKLFLKSLKVDKLISYNKNFGKTHALKAGFNKSKGEIIVFLDADLKGFKIKHLIKLLKPIQNNDYDVVLANRELETKWFDFGNFTTCYSGEKAIKREVLDNNPEIMENKGYRFEPAFNKVVFRKYKTTKVLLKDLHQTWKNEKIGELRGRLANIFNILDYLFF